MSEITVITLVHGFDTYITAASSVEEAKLEAKRVLTNRGWSSAEVYFDPWVVPKNGRDVYRPMKPFSIKMESSK